MGTNGPVPTGKQQQVLQNVEQFDVEYQHAVRRNAANALSAVSQFARHVQAPFAAGIHQLQGFGPAGDYATHREFCRLATLVGAVEHRAVDQGAVIVSAHLVFTGGLGAITGRQHFKLQAGSQGGDALTLGVFSQERQASAGSGFSLGSGLGLHDFADDLEAGSHLLLVNTAWFAGECVGQASQDRVQAHTRWWVVAQLVAQLTADTVADAGFVGGQINFGHEEAPL